MEESIQQLMNAVQTALILKKNAFVASLLDDAIYYLELTDHFHTMYSDQNIFTLHIYVSLEKLELFTDDIKKLLMKMIDLVRDKSSDEYISKIEISLSYKDISPQPTKSSEINIALPPISIFGSPSQALNFKYDIFVIMPFQEDFKPIYEKLIAPIAKNLNLTIIRGDYIFTQHDIMFDVWSMLNACQLVIADCTNKNPNVFYELGIAHTIGKPVIMITQDLEELPFDVKHRRAIRYNRDFNKIAVFQHELENAIRSLLPSTSQTDDIPF